MPLLKEENYTIDDIYALPEGERAELIDGKMYMMVPPSTTHQLLMNSINIEIGSYIKSKGEKCKVIPAPFAVFLKDEKEKDSYVEPDISVVCDSSKLDDKGCHGAPDWVIEIVSPSSKKMDYSKKQALYCDAGVREYWIVDPAREVTVIYRSEEDWVPVFHKFGEKLRAGIYDDLEIVVE